MRVIRNPIGFTLIELLVVITVIVVLLALLTPALDKAIYQAELAVCGTNQRTVASGVSQYAMNFRRHYPYRAGVRDRFTPWRITKLAQPYSWAGGVFDDRVALQGFVPSGALLDALTEPIDIGLGETDENSFVFSSYALWFGWQYYYGSRVARPGDGYRTPGGMFRLGDRWGWGDSTGQTDKKYNVIVCDPDWLSEADQQVVGAHPDSDGVMVQRVFQDEYYPGADVGSNDGEVPGATITVSDWASNNSDFRRGLIDTNAAFSDGSVKRFNAVERRDERMDPVPIHANIGNYPGYANYVPRN